MNDLALYHWAPTTRRNAILRRGLVPGSLSRCRRWRPPYVCLSDSPPLAWALSGQLDPEPKHWDLWMVWASCLTGYEQIPFDDGGPSTGDIKEYRVYHRIYKRDLWYVATRTT